MTRLVTPKAFKNPRDRSNGNTAVCARSIGEALACITNAVYWNGDSQEDAAEFQRLLLQRVEEGEMDKLGASSIEATGVHQLFRGEIKQTVSQG